jgi:predicted ABC-type exoprotein transport system permease subunit
MDKEYWFNLSLILFLIIMIGLMIRDYGEYLK